MTRYMPLPLLLLAPLVMADSAPGETAAIATPAEPAPAVVQAAVEPPAPAAVAPAAAAASPVASGAVDAAMAEIAAWNAIKGSENSADYRAYLQRYPGGSFADLADFRIREIETRKMLAESAAEWLRLRDSEDLEGVEAFLKKYPQSPAFSDAEALVRTLRPLTLVVHYIRRDQMLLGWKLHHVLSRTTVPFDRIDEVGGIAHLSVKAKLAARRSGFTVSRGDAVEDCGGPRELRWDRPAEVWLLEQDCTVYTSLASARKAQAERVVPQGHRRLHFVRKDGQEAAWSFALKSDKLLGGLFSMMSRKESVPLAGRDSWGAWADWKEQEGQAGAALLLALTDGKDQKENCAAPLRWPAEAGPEAWYVAGSCTLAFTFEEALKVRRKSLATP